MTAVVPSPRAPKGLDRPAVARARTLRPPVAAPLTDPGAGMPVPVPTVPTVRRPPVLPSSPSVPPTAVALTRTPHGWAVIGPCASPEPAANLVEGLTLADLVVEELGGIPAPDRTARRSARGGSPGATDAADPRDARIAALERTVAQLEHALAARVATERAIGVLSERHGVSPREAFDALRHAARTQSRPAQEVAREVLEGTTDPVAQAPVSGGPAARGRAADGRS